MPKNEEPLAILRTRQGTQIPLKSVKADARLRDLFAEVTVEQRYRNEAQSNIEAVYTFPLPLGAVLLGFEVELAGKKLAGQVVERKQAERDYEDAITDGNSAIMLEEAGPGLYTVSLGNLMADEDAVIRFRYGLLLSWQGTRLRLLLPTTIAPRYGDALAAGLEAHQVPVSSLDVDYPLDLSIHVEGRLAEAALASPTHAVTCHRSETGMMVRLGAGATLDRDFVLTLDARDTPSVAVVTPSGDRSVAMTALRVPAAADSFDAPIAIKIVIDCSGSMAGTSIAQARKAALEILNLLRPQDHFAITLFGSTHQHCFSKMVPATARYITDAWNKMERLGANLGGTEMESALLATFAIPCPAKDPQVLLITDGEIHEHQKLVAQAAKAGHRIFTVGVGHAVAEAFLRALSEKTGGACELVSPQEGMAERVVQQFHRMRQPKLSGMTIRWPGNPAWTTPLPETVFAGDTIHAFAGFDGNVAGDVTLENDGAQAPVLTVALSPTTEPEIPRYAAARRMASLPYDQAIALALEHQLLSKGTNYLIVAEREAKAENLPEVQQVPQMLAAGWGGVGIVARGMSSSLGCAEAMLSSGVDRYDIPAFLRRQTDDGSQTPLRTYSFQSMDSVSKAFNTTRERIRQIEAKALRRFCMPTRSEKLDAPVDTSDATGASISPAEFVANLSGKLAASGANANIPATVVWLEQCGLDRIILDDLRAAVANGHSEDHVVLGFLFGVIQSRLGELVEREVKRRILKAWKEAAPDASINDGMQHSLGLLDIEFWNWRPLRIDEPASTSNPGP